MCVYTAHSSDTNRGPGPLMGLREFIVSSFMVYSLVRDYSLIKSLYLLTELVDPRNEDGSAASWCQFLAALTWWDVSWRHQVLEHCVHTDQIYLLTQAGFGAQKESPEIQQGQNSGKGKVQKPLLASVWPSHGKEKLFSVPETFFILRKWLLDATAQLIISSSFLARFW